MISDARYEELKAQQEALYEEMEETRDQYYKIDHIIDILKWIENPVDPFETDTDPQGYTVDDLDDLNARLGELKRHWNELGNAAVKLRYEMLNKKMRFFYNSYIEMYCVVDTTYSSADLSDLTEIYGEMEEVEMPEYITKDYYGVTW